MRPIEQRTTPDPVALLQSAATRQAQAKTGIQAAAEQIRREREQQPEGAPNE